MRFIVKNCARCGTNHVQMNVIGTSWIDQRYHEFEIFVACAACKRGSVYFAQLNHHVDRLEGNLDNYGEVAPRPIFSLPDKIKIDNSISERVRELFDQASACRRLGMYDAAGAIFRKTIDVATKVLYANHPKLDGKKPADALRSRIKALGDMRILEEDIVEIADVAAMDGNDAAHDADPYTSGEAEALELLTMDLLDRLFVRPARVAAMKEKQIAAGQRKEA